jgi:protein dispatched 1
MEKFEEKVYSSDDVKWRYTSWMVDHMWLAYSVMLTSIVLLTVLFVALQVAGVGVELVTDGGSPLEDRDELGTNREYAYDNAQKDLADGEFQAVQSRRKYPLAVYFEVNDDDGEGHGVFSSQRVADMRSVEQRIVADGQWPQYCWTANFNNASDVRCAPPISVLNYFYPEVLPNGDFLYNGRGDALVQPINETLALMADADGQFRDAYAFVDFDFSTANLRSTVTRLLAYAGLPRDGFDNEYSDEEKQRDEVSDYYVDEFYEPLVDAEIHRGDTWWIGLGVTNKEILGYVLNDLLFVVPSLLFVFALLYVQTRSLWVATNGALQIGLSFPAALLLYRVIFQQTFFSFFHVLALYITLAIGADDIFVFYDAFRNSARLRFDGAGDAEGGGGNSAAAAAAADGSERLKARLGWAWSKAAKAMAVTSVTTFCAFVILVALPFAQLRVFGLFCALLSVTNYVFVITLFPCVMVVSERVFERRRWPCCRRCSASTCFAAYGCGGDNDDARALADADDGDDWLRRALRRFYATPLLSSRLGAALCVLALAALAVATVTLTAVKTEPSDEPFQLVPDGYNFQEALVAPDKFASSVDANTVTVAVMFGVLRNDFAGTDSLDRYDAGSAVYDDTFDLSEADSQAHFLSTCAQLANDAQLGEQLLVRDVYCFLEAFDAWLIATGRGVPPLVGQAFVDALAEFAATPPFNAAYGDMIGFVGGELRFAVIEIDTDLPHRDTFPDALPHRDDWWRYVGERNDAAPSDAIDKAFATTTVQYWGEFESEKVLYDNTWVGIGVSLAIAFGTLTLFTLNVVVAAYAVVSIGCVVAALLAMYVALGYDFGLTESISSILVVGLAVDFTAHFAASYVDCSLASRGQRVVYAMHRVTVAVLSGAISSLGASFFLFFCQVSVLKQFGVSFFIIILASLLYAMLFFMPLLTFIGPERSFGDLRRPLHAIVRFVTCKRCSFPNVRQYE